MFTIKAFHSNSDKYTQHTFEALDYSVYQNKGSSEKYVQYKNIEGDEPILHLGYETKGFYNHIIIENSAGKTTDIFRAAHASPRPE